MVPTVAFLVTILAVMSHISHARLPTSQTLAPTPPKPTHCEWRVPTNKSGDVRAPIREAVDAAELRRQFLQVLRSRRCAEVPLSVEPAKPVENPVYQDGAMPPDTRHSSTKGTNFTHLLHEENLYSITEAGEQGRVPVLILSLKQDSHGNRPAIVFLHGTSWNKESLRPLLEAYASRGYIAVAIDSRYHGERAQSNSAYQDALVSSWKKGDTMPFIFDTAWDLIKLADYLTQRKDIDHDRIGITGISLGGMHAWFGGFADTRYSVVVPIIGVQGFRWAIDNNDWQARVKSIERVFEAARKDLKKPKIDKEVVEKVWDRIAPGLDSTFDSPYTIPAISPRPLLIVNGADDPRCPLQGLYTPVSRATKAYKEAKVPDNFKMIAEAHVGHNVTLYGGRSFQLV